ncbi:hypothetical protein GCM10007242_32470 [Pigmentiphaga litoralis]|nr:hypothetical protein GCM10007242_32470 [Pigmentiphaga litoralis]
MVRPDDFNDGMDDLIGSADAVDWSAKFSRMLRHTFLGIVAAPDHHDMTARLVDRCQAARPIIQLT